MMIDEWTRQNQKGLLPSSILLGLIAALLAVYLSMTGLFDRLELTFRDMRSAAATLDASDKTVIVALDQKTLARFGGFPIARSQIGKALEQLALLEPRRAYLDIIFGYEGQKREDDQLLAGLNALGPERLALPVYDLFERDQSGEVKAVPVRSVSKFTTSSTLVSADLPFDVDSRIRSVGKNNLGEFAALPTVAAWLLDGKESRPQTMDIDFGINASTVPIVSFADLVDGTVEREHIAGKDIIIGLTVSGVVQALRVPRYKEISRPHLFALSVETQRLGRIIKPVGTGYMALGTILFTLLLSIWMMRYGALGGIGVSIMAAVAAISLASYLREEHLLDMPVMIPLLALFFLYVGVQLRSHPAFARVRQAFQTMLDKIDLSHIRLLHNGQDAIVTFSPEGKLLTLNAAAEAMFEQKAQDCIGRSIHEFLPTQSADILSNAAKQQPGRLQTKIPGRDGPAKHLDLSYNAMPVEDGWVGLVSIRDISEMKAREEELAYAATHDSLTGIANRSGFEKHLDAAMSTSREREQAFAILLIDLDKFKQVNDKLGHQVGDGVLKAVSERMCNVLRNSEIPARMGGDEFAVILPAPMKASMATDVAERLINAISQPMRIEGTKTGVGASIGIALYDNPELSTEQLIQLADEALYQAKDNGRNGYVLAQD
ncbi:MAG: diguanylate cyclase [Cohaesibacter sp.]|jgi:diguanylate cyclase (GGDEF)-like protein/PAS domain S-box-containing protein|nr:diguanylate cyclase [Cohaesibacter sp.]